MRETISTFAWDVLKCAFRLKEITAPTTGQVPTNTVALYAKDKAGTSNLYFKNDAGTEYDLSSGAGIVPAAMTRVNDTNVTLTLGGTPATSLLQAVSLTLGWTGTLSAARGGTGVGSLGDLTKTDDTNVTLTLGGTPVGSLINAVSLTLGWTGTLAAARGGTGVSSLGDLTKVDDTNVTLTLGGTPTGALIKSSSITAGWTGQLSIARGGTGQATANAALNALLPSQGSNSGKFLTTNGTDTSWAAVSSSSSSGGASGHLHGLTRLLADGSSTTYNLLDIAEYIDAVHDGGSLQDPTAYTLSSDGSQITFSSAPTQAHFLTINYVIAGL